MVSARLNLPQLGADLVALDALLAEQPCLDEAGPRGLQQFFNARPNLVLLMSRALFDGIAAAAYLPGCSIMQEFYADFAIADKTGSKFLFVEFEHAKRNSIFSIKTAGKSSQSYQWSRTFEHGFSQIVDWYFRLDDYHRTSKIEEHFGAPKIEYLGVLIIGRDHFLKQAGLMQRFEWRRRHTVINSRNLRCFTFDELARELREHYEALLDFDAK
nr:Shedu immune nuclease family protein [Duganella guangzhouensis]